MLRSVADLHGSPRKAPLTMRRHFSALVATARCYPDWGGTGGVVWRRFVCGLVLAGSVGALFVAGAARAADLPPPVYKPAPPAPPPLAPVAWSAFYVGGALNWV